MNTCAPGATNVERNLLDDPRYGTTWGKMVPLQRTAEPEDREGPAVFLASEDSSYMSGQVFHADGGGPILQETYIGSSITSMALIEA